MEGMTIKAFIGKSVEHINRLQPDRDVVAIDFADSEVSLYIKIVNGRLEFFNAGKSNSPEVMRALGITGFTTEGANDDCSKV